MVDLTLRDYREQEDGILKLLLLGAGESGKSTIFKQIRHIFNNSYKDDDARRPFARIIQHNVAQAMKTLVDALEYLNLPISHEAMPAAAYMREYRLEDRPTAVTFQHIKTLWKDQGIRDVFEEHRAAFQLIDTADLFFAKIDDVADDDYVPSYSDVLHCRARTSGITESFFELKGNKFQMIDVGGQRTERKKWIHCFENVTAIVFVVALSEYDQSMFEDMKTNRIHDALDLFEQISNLRWFQHTAIILFLNKRDLFEIKIRRVDLKCCFPEYKGGCHYASACKYIDTQFKARCHQRKKIYSHITCATDTNNVEFTFNAVKDIIIENGLRRSGLIS